jgi:hypothetical protein
VIVFACSGPGASEAIAKAWLVGWALSLASTVGVVVAAFVRRRFGSGLTSPGTLLGVLVLGLHPGFWCLPVGGDCGRARITFSLGWGAVSAAYVAGSMGWAVVAARRAQGE